MTGFAVHNYFTFDPFFPLGRRRFRDRVHQYFKNSCNEYDCQTTRHLHTRVSEHQGISPTTGKQLPVTTRVMSSR